MGSAPTTRLISKLAGSVPESPEDGDVADAGAIKGNGESCAVTYLQF